MDSRIETKPRGMNRVCILRQDRSRTAIILKKLRRRRKKKETRTKGKNEPTKPPKGYVARKRIMAAELGNGKVREIEKTGKLQLS